jgi:hypothetical protein
MNKELTSLKKTAMFALVGLALWGVVAWLFMAVPLVVVNVLPSLLPLSVFAFLLFLVGLLLLAVAAVSIVRSHAPHYTWIIFLAASSVIVLYNLSPLAPAWNCFGKRIYVEAVNAAGQNCTEVCTNNKLKPCGGWSSCWDKNISCSASGIDQDGRSCRGCCFSCDVVCEPEPDPDQPPTITSNISCLQWGSNGWCVGSESLNLTASDPQGYTLTITGSIGGTPFTCAAGGTCSKSLPDGNGAISYTVTASQSGKSADGTTAWKRDTTPPAVVQVVPSPTGSNGWFDTAPVTISAGGSDAVSGLASARVSVNGGIWQSSALLDLDGVYTVDFRVVDNAGNTTTSTRTIYIDTTPPSFTHSSDGILGNAPWYVSSTTTTIAPTDLLSGIDYIEYNANSAGRENGSSIVSNDGVNTIFVRVYDVAGNSTTGSISVSVDTTPPVITPSLSGGPGLNGWITTAGIVSALVDDATSGVDAGADVSIDGGSSWQSAPISLGDGNYSMTFRGFDIAGNEGTASLNASIDTVDPDISFVFKGIRGKNGWYVSDVDVSASAIDALSGVDYSEVRVTGGAWLAETRLSDGVYDLEARAGDLAGNTNSISDVIRIDTKSPVSLFTSHTENEVVAGIVHLQGVSSDMLSGLNAVEVSTDGGSTWKEASLSGDAWNYEWDTTTLQNGAYTVKIRGVDGAGNRENPIPLTLLADNFPPHVKITDSWWIWESGNVKVSENGFSVGEIKVTISDPQGRWPAVVLTYNPSTTSFDLTWDRRFSDGTLAPSGTYPVSVLACDVHGNCASDRGVINIPFIAPVPPTATPSLVPSPRPVSSTTAVPSPTPHAQIAATRTPLPDFVERESEQPITADPNTPTMPLLAVVCLIALMWAISSAALADPRPSAILAIAKTLSMKKDKTQS